MNAEAGNESESAVSLSPSAAQKVRELAVAQRNSDLMLRIFIEGGGCSGFQYGFEFAEQPADDDAIVEKDGVKMVVDPMSYQYLMGAEVDYKNDLQGARFIINNPNATTTCGCGSSFGV